MISTALPIETPEGITFTHEPATITDRGWAYLLDFLIRVGVVIAVGIPVLIMTGPAVQAGIGLMLIISFAVEWGYYVLLELLMNGQSIGKKALSLRVVKTAGHPIGFYDSVLRNLLRAADMLPLTYAVATVSVLATRRFQRLGDLAAGTIVIRERQRWTGSRVPRLDPNLARGEHRKVLLSNRERRLLQEFVVRMDRLHPDRREQIARILAEPYRARFQLDQRQSATELLVKLYTANALDGAA